MGDQMLALLEGIHSRGRELDEEASNLDDEKSERGNIYTT